MDLDPSITLSRLDRRRVLTGLAGTTGLALMAPYSSAAILSGSTPMQTLLDEHLKQGVHPRLHRDADGWAELRRNIKTDAALAHWYQQLQAEAATMMTDAPAAYKLVGPRLLYESRRALRVISTLSGLYQLDGDPRKAERARAELRAICAFPDWHPPHFLDVAEMTNAAALGYDWLYNVLPEDERKTIRKRIIEFGLRPGLGLYNAVVWWSKPFGNNWGQVCAGGLTMGALAIANDEQAPDGTTAPEPAAILTLTTDKVRNNMLNYAPDGGWPEGPAYWSYATNYTCAMISALESALHQDFGLTRMPGFSQTGAFRVSSIGPSNQFFNYADGSATVGRAPEMIWLARRFKTPLYAVSERQQLAHYKPDIFHLVWSQGNEASLTAGSPPLDTHFTKVDVAYLRSSWSDPDAFFIGAKGGGNAVSHAHLDLGSFVLDAFGERWALDLGPDNYDLPDYFGKARWTYYRLRSEGHNTLTLGNANQNTQATAALTDFTSDNRAGTFLIDLSAAYKPNLSHVTRRITLSRGASPIISISDRIEVGDAKLLRWNMHTTAAVEIHGSDAVLTLNGKRLRLAFTAPAGSVIEVISSDAPAPQAQQPKVHNLTVTCPLNGATQELEVRFEAV